MADQIKTAAETQKTEPAYDFPLSRTLAVKPVKGRFMTDEEIEDAHYNHLRYLANDR